MEPSRFSLGTFGDSSYAAELRRRPALGRFPAELERAYVNTRLADRRTLIRAGCLFGAAVVASRATANVLGSHSNFVHAFSVALVTLASFILAFVACSGLFERFYLSLARILVPLRNAVGAVLLVGTAARGHPELLMALPLMILGPFFFMGLSFRAGLVSVIAMATCFAASAAGFGLAVPVAIHSGTFLVLGIAICIVAALQDERSSREDFLRRHYIAELAEHDPLTGTKNRRVFDEHLKRVWQQAIEDDRTIAILLADVDHFKAYNDRYGHQAGDDALRRTAETLQKFIHRPLDVLARYGGEEFAAILYDVNGDYAVKIAEQMRHAINQLPTEHRKGFSSSTITISVGVAVIAPAAERDSPGALQLADQALYRAKMRGRNRVELMDETDYELLVTGVFSGEQAVRAG